MSLAEFTEELIAKTVGQFTCQKVWLLPKVILTDTMRLSILKCATDLKAWLCSLRSYTFTKCPVLAIKLPLVVVFNSSNNHFTLPFAKNSVRMG